MDMMFAIGLGVGTLGVISGLSGIAALVKGRRKKNNNG